MQGESLFELDDPAVEEVVGLLDQEGMDEVLARVFRQAFDEVLDGARTGRWLIEDLSKTEKTYLGTKVEILLRAELDLPAGPVLDFVIAGHEIDCKFSLGGTSWMIPIEAQGKLCLLLTASDVTATYSAGILRCDLARLNMPNRDKKRTISKAGRNDIVWLFRDASMPENLLRNLPSKTVERILSHTGRRGGQLRVDELFRLVHGRIVRREATVTVARQLDGMKRARDSRARLQPEGVIVLGHQGEHPRIAQQLALPVPKKGELVAARIVPCAPAAPRSTVIGGQQWRIATAADPVGPGPTGGY